MDGTSQYHHHPILIVNCLLDGQKWQFEPFLIVIIFHKTGNFPVLAKTLHLQVLKSLPDWVLILNAQATIWHFYLES